MTLMCFLTNKIALKVDKILCINQEFFALNFGFLVPKRMLEIQNFSALRTSKRPQTMQVTCPSITSQSSI